MIIINGNKRPRRMFFEGNSLMEQNQNIDGNNPDMYVARQTFTNLSTLVYVPELHPVSGQTQTVMNAAFQSRIQPRLNAADIVICWEGTNDLHVNGLTGAQAFTNLLTYANWVKGHRAKIVVGTVIARDYVTDAADLMTRIGDYNTLVRANASLFDAVADMAASSLFDTRADASNTTYYHTDKLHIVQGGQDAVITILTNAITPLL